MKVTTLIENETGRRDLKAEHGLSFLVETDGKKILFDAGSSFAVWENAEKLGIFPDQVDILVLSHNHYDHGGGVLPGIRLGLAPEAVVCGEGFFDEKYRKKESEGAYTILGSGLTRKILEENSGGLLVCRELLRLTDHCYAAGRFKRANKWEEISNKFLRRRDGQMEPDDFGEEICLVLLPESRKAAGVIAGCSHPGIVNMLDTLQERFLERKAAFVAGGIHLKDAGQERRRRTLEALKQMGVEQLWLNHCSGELTGEGLCGGKEGITAGRLRAGDVFFFT